MLRRNLTKIELKLEDLNELTNEKNRVEPAGSLSDKTSNIEPLDLVKTRALIESRIGYNPRPRRAN